MSNPLAGTPEARVLRDRPAALLPLLALLILALLPVALVPIPALVDYPNHLARMSVLARAGTAAANPFYQVAWAPNPNLAMDLLVPPLARLLDVETATRLFLLAAQALVLSGAMALSFAVKRRVVGAGLAAVLALYSVPFAWGFVNFQFALGLALWGVAAWVAIGPERPWLRFAVHVVAVAALVVAHLFALGLYGVTLGTIELWRAWAERRGPARAGLDGVRPSRPASPAPQDEGRSGLQPPHAGGRSKFQPPHAEVPTEGRPRSTHADPSLARALRPTLLAFAALAAPVVVIAAFALAFGTSVGGSRNDWGFAHKARWLFALNGFSLELSIVLTAILAALGLLAVRRGLLRFVGPGAWLAAGFGALYLVMPFRLLETAFVDVRVLVAAALILPAFVTVSAPPGRPGLPAAAFAAIGALAVVNLAYVAHVQLGYRSEYRALVASFGTLERGSRVLIAHGGDAPDPPEDLRDYPMYHAPTLAVHYADAFVPTLFTHPGKQPVAPRPEVRRIALPEGGPIPIALLAAVAAGRLSDPALAHVADWARDFDYLYLLAPPAAHPLPGMLTPMSGTARYRLYRITPGHRP